MEFTVDGEKWSLDRLLNEVIDNDGESSDALDQESSGEENESSRIADEVQEASESECSADETDNKVLSAEPSSDKINAPMKKRRVATLIGKNGKTVWTLEMPEKRGRTSRKNLVSHLPGPKGSGKQGKTVIKAWDLLFSTEILKKIVDHTNEDIIARQSKATVTQTYQNTCDELEVRALLGVLYLMGVLKSAHLNLEELWSPKFGAPIFRGTFSFNRFKFLSTCIRFDNRLTRAERRINDTFAPIREVWEMFIHNCSSVYTPFEYCTIDEQLLGFRGNCPFRVYLPSKPDKYGMKIVMMNDARTWYMVDAIPYTGKVQIEKGETVPTYYVRKLSQNIHGTGRNITVDNWFSSIPLFEKMLKEYNITMIGTLRKNKGEIPPSFLRKAEPGTVKSCYSDNKTLVSYTPKPNKVVLVLSTMHNSVEIDETTSKPNVIMDYNSTKGGTDTFDQLCHTYTTARGTRRWPMRYFFGMLDQGAVNAMVLYKMNNPMNKMARREFLKELSWELIQPFMKIRFEKDSMRRGLKEIMRGILGNPEESENPRTVGKKTRGRCFICPRTLDKKTNLHCTECELPVCEAHSYTETICEKCKRN